MTTAHGQRDGKRGDSPPRSTSWDEMTKPKPSPGRLVSSTSTFFPSLVSLATAPLIAPTELSSTPCRSRGSKVKVTGTESRKLVLWMRPEVGGPLAIWPGGLPGETREHHVNPLQFRAATLSSKCASALLSPHPPLQQPSTQNRWPFEYADTAAIVTSFLRRRPPSAPPSRRRRLGLCLSGAGMARHIPPSASPSSSPAAAPCDLSSQVGNGVSGGYACSLPSTPVLAHRELRVAHGEGGGSSRSLKGIPRRPSLFKVSPGARSPPSHAFVLISRQPCPRVALRAGRKGRPRILPRLRLSFRTGTRTREPPRPKETPAPLGPFPSSRLAPAFVRASRSFFAQSRPPLASARPQNQQRRVDMFLPFSAGKRAAFVTFHRSAWRLQVNR